MRMPSKVAAKVYTARKAAKKATQRPVPDVKSATAEILSRVAAWMSTNEADQVVHGRATAATHSQTEWTALEEARALATEYVRMGARL